MAEIDINDENLIIYLEESNEYLSDIENDLLSIEQDGENIDEELVNKVFRAAHTVKGGAGFFNLKNIKKLGHKIENILDMIRSRQMVPTSEIINILLISFDRLRELLNDAERSNDADISEMLTSLSVLLKSSVEEEEKKESLDEFVEIKHPVTGFPVIKIPAFDYNQTITNGSYIYLIEIDLIHDLQFKGKNPLDLHRDMLGTGIMEEIITDFSYVGTLDDSDINQIPMYVLFSTVINPEKIFKLFELDESQIHVIYTPETEPVKSAEKVQPESKPEIAVPTIKESREEEEEEELMSVDEEEDEGEVAIKESTKQSSEKSKDATAASSSLRVKVELLEQLMTLAGELVLSRNELNEAISSKDNKRLTSSGQRISQVTSEIQEAIMMTRLQNVGSVFNKFPRIVRDMSLKMNKEINLKIFGKEVELDKTIIEGLNDPLTHMVRNSIDHGIESPNIRNKSKKPRIGEIVLKAYHEAGQVIIEISDDGKGLNPDKIANKAIKNGIITKDEAANMGQKEKMNLIFQPGLSTAEKVTDVSGRGVGMDVVKSKLDELGGVIDIDSTIGKGSTFRIKLPLTLAIIPSLLVESEGERFAIPQLNIEELINIPAKEIQSRVEKIGYAEVLDLRGDLIPLIQLTEALGIPRTYTDTQTGEVRSDRRQSLSDRRKKSHSDVIIEEKELDELRASEEKDRRNSITNDINVVIVSAGLYKYGLVVGDLDDNLEIVVKPLGKHINACKEYAGATIMGDGRVALIIDVAGIADAQDIQSISRSVQKQDDTSVSDVEQDIHSYLLFRSSREEYCAMPMQLVARVEHIKASQLEYLSGKRIIQYRGKSLPVVALQDVSECQELEDDLPLSVIVTDIYDQEIGLLAVRPIDSMEIDLEIDKKTLRQKGVLGSAIINDKTTLILDIFEIIESTFKDIAEHHKVDDKHSESPLILLAEDSSFFRNQMQKFIKDSGYRVMEAEDGQFAWEALLDSDEKPSLIVTDIEMPRMSGYDLATNAKADSRFSDIPIIAVTSLAGDSNVQRGFESGIDEYHVKLDKDKLLKSIKKLIPVKTSQALKE